MSVDRTPIADYSTYAEVATLGRNEDQRPWDIADVIGRYISPNSRVLDAGTGSAAKLVQLRQKGLTSVAVGFDNAYFRSKTGEDVPSRTPLLDIARTQADGHFVNILAADSERMPFPRNSFDVVTFNLSTPYPEEAHRVLRQGGVVIMEVVGEGDKRNIKDIFGIDSEGKPRGYKTAERGSLLKGYVSDFEKAGFVSLHEASGSWETRYTRKELEGMLIRLNNRFVINYNEVSDRTIVDEVVDRLSYKSGPYEGLIPTNQHRLLYIGRKQ